MGATVKDETVLLRRELARLHLWASCSCLVAYAGTLAVYTWTTTFEPAGVEAACSARSEYGWLASSIAAASFANTVVFETHSLVAGALEASDRRIHEAFEMSKQVGHSAPSTESLEAEPTSWYDWYVGSVDSSKLMVVTINFVACLTHVFMMKGTFPVLVSFRGRRNHVARAAEWTVLVPMLMILLHSYEGMTDVHGLGASASREKAAADEDITKHISSPPQPKAAKKPAPRKEPARGAGAGAGAAPSCSAAVVSTSSAAWDKTARRRPALLPKLDLITPTGWYSIFAQTASTHLGIAPSLWRMPDWLAWGFVGIAAYCYLKVFTVVADKFQTHRDVLKYNLAETKAWAKNHGSTHAYTSLSKTNPASSFSSSSSRVAPAPPSKEEEEPPEPLPAPTSWPQFREWVAQSERAVQSSRAATLAAACACIWSVIVATWVLGLFDVISIRTEHILLCIIDVASKKFYTYAMGDAHARAFARQRTSSTLLSLERTATAHRRRFLRYVMHEFRVPLNALKLGVNFVEDCLESNEREHRWQRTEEVNGVLKMIDGSIDMMGETLNDVLSFAAIEEGRLELNCEVFNMRDAMTMAASSHSVSAKGKGIDLRLEVADGVGPLELYGDVRRIVGCVSNFISNAIKFSSEGTRIDVIAFLSRAEAPRGAVVQWPPPPPPPQGLPQNSSPELLGVERRSGGEGRAVEVTVEVRDSGVGISEADLRRLFTAFSQIRPGELQAGRGSGLGLAISREVMENHGGRISARSELGAGSIFTLALPLAVVASRTKTTTPTPTPTPTTTTMTMTTKRTTTTRTKTTRMAAHRPTDAVARMTGPVTTTRKCSEGATASVSLLASTPISSSLGAPSPLASPPLTTRSIPAGSPEPRTRARPGRDGAAPRALVVDDVPSNRKLFGMRIKKLGFVVQGAADGALAVEAVLRAQEENKPFDIVFMDSIMPVLNGLDATAQLRRGGFTGPIVGVTGNALAEDVRAFMDAGASAVLPKPISMVMLEKNLTTLGFLSPSSL